MATPPNSNGIEVVPDREADPITCAGDGVESLLPFGDLEACSKRLMEWARPGNGKSGTQVLPRIVRMPLG
jgi:hypothetical protein